MAPSATIATEIYTLKDYNNHNIVTVNHGGEQSNNGALVAKLMIQSALQNKVDAIDVDTCLPGEEDAFYVADLGEVYRQHLRWKINLGSVKPYYAVKCNPDPQVLRLLASLGTGFDCASKSEIEQVLGLGVDPSRIIYAQPCKTKSYIRYAAEHGVKQMTFDNTDELYKVRAIFSDAELVLRIVTDDSASLCRLSTKYGATLPEAQKLLALAKELGLDVVGVSFHVGSGAGDPSSFTKSIQDARRVMDQAADFGFTMKLLDVGGGFEDSSFELFAGVLGDALREYIPDHIRIIGEPGRYYVANAFTLAANVIARRDEFDELTGERAYRLYLNDGAYGNFSNIIFDHQHPVAQILRSNNRRTDLTNYSIWGPTCDGIDVITEECYLPGVLEVGDWLFFENMGAYTKCSATRFNGFTDNHEVIYISSEPGASALLRYGRTDMARMDEVGATIRQLSSRRRLDRAMRSNRTRF